jgi:hypothetical protein
MTSIVINLQSDYKKDVMQITFSMTAIQVTLFCQSLAGGSSSSPMDPHSKKIQNALRIEIIERELPAGMASGRDSSNGRG